MKKYLLIDGYNIINSWAVLKEAAEISLEEARSKLIDLLADYKSYTGQEIWVIFDAHQVKGVEDRQDQLMGINIVFTKENQTADSFIEIKVKELTRNRRNEVRVATSDWAEQQVIMGSGGIRISSRELLIEIEQNVKKIEIKTDTINKEKSLLYERIDKKTAKMLDEWRKKKE
ncbi:MAG: NYN domain-containing protein [Clostridia bacterium]|nr:NYN domain-containing protein [Clostridia bacterium]